MYTVYNDVSKLILTVFECNRITDTTYNFKYFTTFITILYYTNNINV